MNIENLRIGDIYKYFHGNGTFSYWLYTGRVDITKSGTYALGVYLKRIYNISDDYLPNPTIQIGDDTYYIDPEERLISSKEFTYNPEFFMTAPLKTCVDIITYDRNDINMDSIKESLVMELPTPGVIYGKTNNSNLMIDLFIAIRDNGAIDNIRSISGLTVEKGTCKLTPITINYKLIRDFNNIWKDIGVLTSTLFKYYEKIYRLLPDVHIIDTRFLDQSINSAYIKGNTNEPMYGIKQYFNI